MAQNVLGPHSHQCPPVLEYCRITLRLLCEDTGSFLAALSTTDHLWGSYDSYGLNYVGLPIGCMFARLQPVYRLTPKASLMDEQPLALSHTTWSCSVVADCCSTRTQPHPAQLAVVHLNLLILTNCQSPAGTYRHLSPTQLVVTQVESRVEMPSPAQFMWTSQSKVGHEAL